MRTALPTEHCDTPQVMPVLYVTFEASVIHTVSGGGRGAEPWG